MTNVPKASLVDPGIYTELSYAVTPYWTTITGGRVDLSDDGRHLHAGMLHPRTDLEQNDTLAAFYVRNVVELNPNWSTEIALGHSQITPDLFQRYSNGVFLGIIQSGFSRVVGDPTLDKEQLWQIDWSVDAKFERARGRASVFHAWINDYVTYGANIIGDPTGARLLYGKHQFGHT